MSSFGRSFQKLDASPTAPTPLATPPRGSPSLPPRAAPSASGGRARAGVSAAAETCGGFGSAFCRVSGGEGGREARGAAEGPRAAAGGAAGWSGARATLIGPSRGMHAPGRSGVKPRCSSSHRRRVRYG
ncbi:hypothetical protein AB1Y20_012641 [Prymnesium parvum]|uniref:Uncharacterized protein n=1 Tax=Prymnesium parvum TaxID=97485 RepID=A0AB34IM08_PRYPA